MNKMDLYKNIDFLETKIKERLSFHISDKVNRSTFDLTPIKGKPFENILNNQAEVSNQEKYLLLLALAPHLHPGFYNKIVAEYLPNGGEFPEFGGWKGMNNRNILPTGETALFILAGDDLEKRLEVQKLFSAEHWFYQKNILQLESVPYGEPSMSGRILLDPEVIELLTMGKVSKPRFSSEFPAEYITTEMEWDDLVLEPNTISQIFRIESWVKHQHIFYEEWGMSKKIKPGYRVLFHGPPGTGKTLTATLLGKATGLDVFKIDLSMVVSKYIGETEKNLARLFDKAQHKNWILFFDEADALFGKRTTVRDAHDKYANQEVSYLLQRIETFPGLVILASNFKSNIDDAFRRRFQSIIYFPMPNAEKRLQLWKQSFPEAVKLNEEVNLPSIAERYELSGANIMNVVQQSCINALAEESHIITPKNLNACIGDELMKEGKLV